MLKMGYSKADFKARRESLGLTQRDVAEASDVAVMTVKRWENPYYSDPPEDAWEWIEDCERLQAEVVDAAVSTALAHGAKNAQLTYYRNQEQYDELGGNPGLYGVANTNARMVSTRLKSLKIDVDFCYPDDEDSIYHGAKKE